MNKKQLMVACIIGFSLLCITPISAEDIKKDEKFARFEEACVLILDEKLTKQERAELLYEKATLMFDLFEGEILRTPTVSLISAITLEPNNKEYREYLYKVYNEYWKYMDLSGEDEISAELRKIYTEVKKKPKNSKENE